jgi:hypothetical protein
MPTGLRLLVDGIWGQYIPQRFANNYPIASWSGIPEETRAILLKGPEAEHYDEAWDEAIKFGVFTDAQGKQWKLSQDGCLFAYCEELMTEQERLLLFGE